MFLLLSQFICTFSIANNSHLCLGWISGRSCHQSTEMTTWSCAPCKRSSPSYLISFFLFAALSVPTSASNKLAHRSSLKSTPNVTSCFPSWSGKKESNERYYMFANPLQKFSKLYFWAYTSYQSDMEKWVVFGLTVIVATERINM